MSSKRRPEWLSGSEQGFDGFISENDECSHRPEAGRESLVARDTSISASSDSDLNLFRALIARASFQNAWVAERSIVIEFLIIYELDVC